MIKIVRKKNGIPAAKLPCLDITRDEKKVQRLNRSP
jgi:hypothetical protein